ncbi:MAG: cytochrome C oxidase subunit IV family protein [Bdellovibrionaceae bacterium]|nr:cytochrome C oxidase subunit IV family protein [Pseudobdellovibrionaceae bacterium]
MAHHEEHHHITLATHLQVFSALIGLTILTVVTAKFMHLGVFENLVAFSIATVKGFLVMAYFMHLKYDEKIYRWIILSSFAFVFLLFFFCVLDEATRIVQHSALQ